MAADADILLEITATAGFLRVAAVDAATGEEVAFMAPHGTPEAALARLAREKLAIVRNRRNAGHDLRGMRRPPPFTAPVAAPSSHIA